MPGTLGLNKKALCYEFGIYKNKVKYQPNSAGGTRSPPATLHPMHNPNCPLGVPKWPMGSGKMFTPRFLALPSTFAK